jgi:hypothetical protein
MNAPRVTSLAIKGLVTTPNEYGVYPEGSCSVMDNWLARAANQWVAARDMESVLTFTFTGSAFYKLIGVGPGSFVAFRGFTTGTPNTVWDVVLNGLSSQQFTKLNPLTNNLFDYRWLTPIVARNRLYANGKEGVIVFDRPTVAGSVMRPGGLPQLSYTGRASGSGTVVPASTTFTYSALVRRKSADGYAITSPPSAPFRFSAGGAPSFYFRWESFDDFLPGDVVELYRSAGISGLDPVTDTGTSMRLVSSIELTSTDISNQYVQIFDRQPTVGPLFETDGIEIYTSPYQDGSSGANLPPPSCKAMAQWGTYTFFGNITDDPIWTFDVPAGVVNDFYDPSALDPWVRANGVGVRNFTGTRAIGSPTLTAVSAADIVGLKPGQIFTGTGFAGSPTVVSVGASSVTVSVNSSTAGTAVCQTEDILILNGTTYPVDGYMDLVERIGGQLSGLAFYPSETLPISGVQHLTGITIVMRPKRSGVMSTITVRGTNGANYSPVIPEYNQTVKTITRTERPNVLRWSRSNQPEAVPSPNEAYIGSGQIIRLLATTDCLWILCTDGAYRLSGSAGVWRADLVDASFVPIGPDACCVLNDVVYAYTPRGMASLSGTQTSLLTKGVLDAQFPVLSFSADSRVHLWANTATEEVLAVFEGATLGSTATIYVYSTLYQQWSEYEPTDRKFTAFAMYQPSAAQGQYPLIATYDPAIGDGQAYVRSWRADSGTPLDPFLVLQPFYGGDPLTQKHWIDCTWIADAHNFAQCFQYITPSGASSGFGYFKSTQARDWRVSLGIRRLAAIAPSIVLHARMQHFTLTPITLKGLSMRVLPLTTQQRSR